MFGRGEGGEAREMMGMLKDGRDEYEGNERITVGGGRVKRKIRLD